MCTGGKTAELKEAGDKIVSRFFDEIRDKFSEISYNKKKTSEQDERAVMRFWKNGEKA